MWSPTKKKGFIKMFTTTIVTDLQPSNKREGAPTTKTDKPMIVISFQQQFWGVASKLFSVSECSKSSVLDVEVESSPLHALSWLKDGRVCSSPPGSPISSQGLKKASFPPEKASRRLVATLLQPREEPPPVPRGRGDDGLEREKQL